MTNALVKPTIANLSDKTHYGKVVEQLPIYRQYDMFYVIVFQVLQYQQWMVDK